MTAPKVERRVIPSGEAGTVETLKAMQEAVASSEGAHNPEVRFLAQRIVEGVGNKDYYSEVRALYDFMRANVRYTLDPRGLEWVQTPWVTLLVQGQGDCDDHAVAIAALAIALGHGAGFRTVKGDPSRPDEWSHVYPVIGIRERGVPRWIPIDTTEVSRPRFDADPPGADRVEMKTWVVAPA
jgi:transglutaminase-like putative cysteine protease